MPLASAIIPGHPFVSSVTHRIAVSIEYAMRVSTGSFDVSMTLRSSHRLRRMVLADLAHNKRVEPTRARLAGCDAPLRFRFFGCVFIVFSQARAAHPQR